MDYINFKVNMCEITIKSMKKDIWTLYGVLSFQVIVAIFEILVNLPLTSLQIFPLICIGSLVMNCLWMLMQLTLNLSDLRFEKQKLSHYIDWSQKEEYQEALKNLRREKETYEDYTRYAKIQVYMKNSNEVSPENKSPESMLQEVEK